MEATDGTIGSVDEANNAVGDSYIVVDTGPWIFGKKVLPPASTVAGIDREKRTVFVSRSKQEIKDAPEFNEAAYEDKSYRDEVGGYYAPLPRHHVRSQAVGRSINTATRTPACAKILQKIRRTGEFDVERAQVGRVSSIVDDAASV
ncbi:hypothetical protein GCM10010404_04820 [Nonomuraea africana]